MSSEKGIVRILEKKKDFKGISYVFWGYFDFSVIFLCLRGKFPHVIIKFSGI